MDSQFGNKLEFNYQNFGKMTNSRTKKKLHCRQPKHTIEEILGIKHKPERKKEICLEDMHDVSDSESIYAQAQQHPSSPEYKSGKCEYKSFHHFIYFKYKHEINLLKFNLEM